MLDAGTEDSLGSNFYILSFFERRFQSFASCLTRRAALVTSRLTIRGSCKQHLKARRFITTVLCMKTGSLLALAKSDLG